MNYENTSVERLSTKHGRDLSEAIHYLPKSFDQGILFRALKTVYPNKGFDIAIEWLTRSKNTIPIHFEELWNQSSLTDYQEQRFEQWLKEEIYDLAEKTGWIPKALHNSTQTKHPPLKRMRNTAENSTYSKKKLQGNHGMSIENGAPNQTKSYMNPQVVNKYGGCFKQPFFQKGEIPEDQEEFLSKCKLLVDCEVRILDAAEYVIEKYGREPDKIDVKYRIRLDNKIGENKIVQATHEELTTMSRFSSFLVSKGFVKFQGNKNDFDEFHWFLLKVQSYPMVRVPGSWGEYKPGVFLFENGIYCTQSKAFYPANDEHQIPYKNTFVVCPSGSEQVKPPKLQLVKPDTIHFLTDTFLLWESFNGALNIRTTIAYAIGCVFSQEIIDNYRGFPMLFKHGVRGTGKSTSMDWFMALFGYLDGNRQSVTKDNTKKSVLRKLTLVKSFPFFFDDYRDHEKNSEAPNLTSSFLNWYTRMGTGMAEKSTDHQTVDTHMKGCIVLTGNDKPIDSAALSRMIILNFNGHIKGDQIKDVNKISFQTHRLSEFLALVLENYELIRCAFFDFFANHQAYLSEKNFEGRTVNNWAFILAGVECLKLILPDLGWHEEMKKFREEVCKHIRREQDLELSQNQLLEFFDSLDYFSSQKKHPDAEFQEDRFFLDRQHFQITTYFAESDNNSEESFNGPAIALHLPGIWNALKHVNADITRKNSRSAIESRIQNSELFVDRSKTVYMYRSHAGSDKVNKRCYLLDLDKLQKNGLLDDLINKAEKHNRGW